jgi:hypothetical protein
MSEGTTIAIMELQKLLDSAKILLLNQPTITFIKTRIKELEVGTASTQE